MCCDFWFRIKNQNNSIQLFSNTNVKHTIKTIEHLLVEEDVYCMNVETSAPSK